MSAIITVTNPAHATTRAHVTVRHLGKVSSETWLSPYSERDFYVEDGLTVEVVNEPLNAADQQSRKEYEDGKHGA